MYGILLIIINTISGSVHGNRNCTLGRLLFSSTWLTPAAYAALSQTVHFEKLKCFLVNCAVRLIFIILH